MNAPDAPFALDEAIAAGAGRVEPRVVCTAEDFSFCQKAVPGFFYRVGCTPPETQLGASAPNHSPRFHVDERCLKLGVKTLAALAVDWLSAND